MPRKVFTAGEVLAASDVNEFLQDQTIMVFAGTAARGSAIPTPTEGMVTYLNDIDSLSVYNGTDFTVDRTIQVFAGTAARGSAIGTAVEGMYTHINDTNALEYYDGSAWVSVGSESEFLGSATFATATSVALDNIFTADYRFYDYYFTAIGSTGSSIAARLRTSVPADHSTSTYRMQTLIVDNTTVTGVTDGETTQWNLSNTRARMFYKHGTITNPFLSEATGLDYYGTDNISDGQLRIDQGAGNNTTASSFAGIRFFVASGTMTGQLSIYGRK